jgi:CRISPR-associated exonuclease Cas4
MNEDNYLLLSGIQHFLFCRRQWAFIHIEQQWLENYLTADGRIMHERAHNDKLKETRGDVFTVRALKISSRRLGLSGECDVVEFHKSEDGVLLNGKEGLWLPFPVEYKRGNGGSINADSLQLCAQAICLEEMLCCEIKEGALYYGEVRRRTAIEFTPDLREQVIAAAEEMHRLYDRGYTPKVRPGKQCGRCSFADICLVKINEKTSAKTYLAERANE